MGPPRDPYSCGCKAVTCQLGKEAYLLVVQMGRTDVNAPGGQLEYPMEVTRATYKLTCMSGGSDISSIVAQQEPDLGLPAISARRPSTKEKGTHEYAKTVAEFRDTGGCDDRYGLLRQCVR